MDTSCAATVRRDETREETKDHFAQMAWVGATDVSLINTSVPGWLLAADAADVDAPPPRPASLGEYMTPSGWHCEAAPITPGAGCSARGMLGKDAGGRKTENRHAKDSTNQHHVHQRRWPKQCSSRVRPHRERALPGRSRALCFRARYGRDERDVSLLQVIKLPRAELDPDGKGIRVAMNETTPRRCT